MKKSTTLILSMVCTVLSVRAQLTPEITTWITDAGSSNFHDIIYSNVQQVQYTEADVFISCNAIPAYDIGPWDDPAMGANQNFVFSITRQPIAATPTPLPTGHIGVWSNGLSVFDIRNGESYHNDDIWHVDAVFASGEEAAPCTGRIAENGEFFNYTAPSCLFDVAANTEHAPIIGYAFDGFPIYGGYGYAHADGTGEIVRMRSGYQLRNITDRTSLPDGSLLQADQYGPAINNNYPLGRYMEDYVFVPGSGDLDEHNGRFCITPEYPNGTYAYFATITETGAPAFPYVIGESYYGRVAEGNIGEYSGHQLIDESAATYTSVGADAAVIDMLVYPNPSTDYLHVYIIPSYANNITATLRDMSGRIVYEAMNMQPGVSYPIDARGLGSGMYFLELKSIDAYGMQKCIIRH
jgi:hypothetical protein